MTKKTALVLGATGGIGRPVARLLAARGWTVRALHRDPGGVKGSEPFDWIQGDALVPQDVARSARDVDVIVHAVKPRQYRDWHKLVLPMIDNAIAAAQGARIVMPGNVYNYGRDAGSLIAEDAPQHPETSKGALRVEMERRIAEKSSLAGTFECRVSRDQRTARSPAAVGRSSRRPTAVRRRRR